MLYALVIFLYQDAGYRLNGLITHNYVILIMPIGVTSTGFEVRIALTFYIASVLAIFPFDVCFRLTFFQKSVKS